VGGNVMKCPSCNYNLKQYKYHGLVVDICPNCKGIWFDPGEMKEYIEFLLKDRNDVPSAKIELNKEIVTIDHITGHLKLCPSCNEPMRKFNYAYDSNIILDRCLACNGIWTDGGEIYKLAVYIKGNPRLDALGNAIIEEKRKTEELNDLIEVSKSLTGNAGAWIFLPKIILPLSDDTPRQRVPVITISIIILSTLIFISQIFFITDINSFFQRFGLIPAHFLSIGLISSMFLHGGLLHLIGNMFFLWLFGDNVEDRFSRFGFLIFYLCCGLSASILYSILNWNLLIPVIGTSGAISGVMGAYFIFYPTAKVKLFFIYKILHVPAFLYLGVWFLFQLMFSLIFKTTGVSNIAWFAHIGGFIFGGLVAFFKKKVVLVKGQ